MPCLCDELHNTAEIGRFVFNVVLPARSGKKSRRKQWVRAEYIFRRTPGANWKNRIGMKVAVVSKVRRLEVRTSGI